MSDDRVIIVPHDLLLSRVVRDEANNLIGGWVKNGGWYFEVKDGEHLCRTEPGGTIVTRYPARPFREVIIPDDVHGSYMDIFAWAREQCP